MAHSLMSSFFLKGHACAVGLFIQDAGSSESTPRCYKSQLLCNASEERKTREEKKNPLSLLSKHFHLAGVYYVFCLPETAQP